MKKMKFSSKAGRGFEWGVLLKGHRPFYALGAVFVVIVILLTLPQGLKESLGLAGGAGKDTRYGWLVKSDARGRKAGRELWDRRRKEVSARHGGVNSVRPVDGAKSYKGPGGGDYEEMEGYEAVFDKDAAGKKLAEAEASGQEEDINSVRGAVEDMVNEHAGGGAGRMEGSLFDRPSGGASSHVSGRFGGGGAGADDPGMIAREGASRGKSTSRRAALLAKSGGARHGRRSNTSGARSFSGEAAKAGKGFSTSSSPQFGTTPGERSTIGAGGANPIGGGGGTETGGGSGAGVGGNIAAPDIGASGPAATPVADTGLCGTQSAECAGIYADFDARIAALEQQLNTCKKMVPAGKKGGMVEVIDQECWDRVMEDLNEQRELRDEAVRECQQAAQHCE